MINEILERSKKILDSSSEKDKIFYQYLNGESIVQTYSNDVSDILKICYSSFTGKKDKISLVKDLQRVKPVKAGLHYSNNLVELIAIALQDFQLEKINLQNYSDTHTAKEAYLVHRLFPEIKYKTPLRIESAIDGLVNDILIGNNLNNWEDKIINSLKEANNLVDIFIISEAYKNGVKSHPVTKYRENIKYLLLFYMRLHNFLNILFTMIFYVFLVGTLIVMLYKISPYIVKNWAIVEPYVFIIQIVVPCIFAITLIVLQVKLDIAKIVRPIQKKAVFGVESFVFKIFGVNLLKILKISSEK